MANHDSGLPSVLTLQQTLLEASILGWYPDGLLGVIGLVHVSPLHVWTHHQVRQWVRVGLIAAPEFDVARHPGSSLRQVACIKYACF